MHTGRGDDVQVELEPAAIAAAGAEWKAAVHSSVFGTIFLYFSFYEAKTDVLARLTHGGVLQGPFNLS